LNRDEKASVVEELREKFARATIALATDYRGLTVPVFQKVRRELKNSNAEIRVAKNTLLRRAVEGSSFENLKEHFQGTTAITVSYDDPVSPAKILTDFAKENPQLVIKGAVLNGNLLSAEEISALAKLPSREVLFAQLLMLMQAVPTNFLQVLAGVPRKLLYLLQAVKEQKEQA